MTADDAFPFDLSLDELHWLAGAFGIISLPLPDHAQPDLSRAQLVDRQRNGHASLLRRGLIQSSPGFGWQVDRLPAAFVQWMASATSMLRVECIEKDGAKSIMHAFTSSEQGVSVEITNGVAHFVLYKTRAALTKSLNVWLKIPPKLEKSKETFSIPQPQTFIPVAWKDTKLAAKILANAGLSKKSKDILEWSTTLDWLVVLSKLRINGESNETSTQFFLCASKDNQWGGNIEKEMASFSPMAGAEANANIEKLL